MIFVFIRENQYPDLFLPLGHLSQKRIPSPFISFVANCFYEIGNKLFNKSLRLKYLKSFWNKIDAVFVSNKSKVIYANYLESARPLSQVQWVACSNCLYSARIDKCSWY